MAKQFVYEQLAALNVAQSQLTKLQQSVADITPFQAKAGRAFDEFLLCETKAAIGDATPAALANARAKWEAAQKELADAEAKANALNPSIRYVVDRIEQLRSEEKAGNLARFGELYAPAIKELDQALAQANKAHQRVLELYQAAMNSGLFLDNTWPAPLQLFNTNRAFVDGRNDYTAWQDTAKAKGLV